jgi:hypothetical protein
MVRTLMELIGASQSANGIFFNCICPRTRRRTRLPRKHLSTSGEHLREIQSNTNDHTGTEHVDRDDHHHAYRDPNRGANHVVPIADEDRGGTTK